MSDEDLVLDNPVSMLDYLAKELGGKHPGGLTTFEKSCYEQVRNVLEVMQTTILPKITVGVDYSKDKETTVGVIGYINNEGDLNILDATENFEEVIKWHRLGEITDKLRGGI